MYNRNLYQLSRVVKKVLKHTDIFAGQINAHEKHSHSTQS